jgi:transcriptional regulator with XRE-family HTH domain
MWHGTYHRPMAPWSALAELAHPGDSIRERRIQLGWTQAELAERTGIPQADISRIENGRLDARWSTIHRLSTALATRERPRRRSLANGGRVAAAPAPSGAQWRSKGRTLPIQHVET